MIQTDLADPEKERFSDEVLFRCVVRSVYPVSWDLDVRLTMVEGLIEPAPVGEVQEMILLQARVEACRFMRAATANAFSFSSGDKRVDKTSQPEHWAKLEADLTASYRQRLVEIKPESGADDYILTPKSIALAVYEQGSEV